MWRCVPEGAADQRSRRTAGVAQDSGSRFEVWGSSVPQLGRIPRQKQTLSCGSWEPLFIKFRGAEQPVLTPSAGRRGRRAPALEGMRRPGICHCDSGQSAARAFPARPRAPDPSSHWMAPGSPAGLTWLGTRGRQASPAPGRGDRAGSTSECLGSAPR